MFDRIETRFATVETIQAELTITMEAGDIYTFPFQFGQFDISKKELANDFSITMSTFFDDEVDLNDTFDELDANETSIDYLHESETYDSYSVTQFVDYLMQSIFDNTNNAIVIAPATGLPSFFAQKLYGPTEAVDFRNELRILNLLNADFPDASETRISGTGTVTVDDPEQKRILGIGTSFTTDFEVNFGLYLFNSSTNQFVFAGIIASIVDNTDMALLNSSLVDPAGIYVQYQIRPVTKPKDALALNMLKSLAAIGGYIFGSAFGINYFVSRTASDATYEVELFDDEILDVGKKPAPVFLRSIEINQLSNRAVVGTGNFGIIEPTVRNIPTLVEASFERILYPNSERSLIISQAAGYPFLNKGVYNDALTRYDTNSLDNATMEQTLCQQGADSYALVYTGRDGLTIEVEVVGFDRIKPWSTVKFASRYPGAIFRISTLSCDFIADKCKLTLYQIN
jgi:hypothetical protein